LPSYSEGSVENSSYPSLLPCTFAGALGVLKPVAITKTLFTKKLNKKLK